MDETKVLLQKVLESVQMLGSEVKSVRMEMDSLHTEVGSLRTDMDSLHTEVRSMRTDMDTLHTEVKSMRTEMDRRFNLVEARLDRFETIMVKREDFLALKKDVEFTYLKSAQNELEINRLKKQ